MIEYKDFVPQIIEEGSLGRVKYESFDDAVQLANEWVIQTNVKVISFETVVLPMIWKIRQVHTNSANYSNGGRFQFVRVWYEERE